MDRYLPPGKHLYVRELNDIAKAMLGQIKGAWSAFDLASTDEAER
jgi:hypothetical protein